MKVEQHKGTAYKYFARTNGFGLPPEEIFISAIGIIMDVNTKLHFGKLSNLLQLLAENTESS